MLYGGTAEVACAINRCDDSNDDDEYPFTLVVCLFQRGLVNYTITSIYVFSIYHLSLIMYIVFTLRTY